MNNNLTTQELEALAQAWFDGLLTREEESVLKRVLSDTAPHSPLLDECRLAMGFESAARHCRQRSPRRRRIWMPAAASAAVAIGLGFATPWPI